MSETTTIGGVKYTVVGTDSSPLLLKNKTGVKIQWGNKLIDLIKNGKIASEGGSLVTSVVSKESDIKSDGIYIIESENGNQLWISKNGTHYNLTGTDLYISASKQQNITVEQQKQALENIGMYYNTLEDVKSANIQNGLVYVITEGTLYTIKEGVVEEFEAKLKTVTVEQEDKEGEVINSSIQIVLSVLDEEYLILKDRRITANYDVHIRNSAQLGSESADSHTGYRLYVQGDKSYLDVDVINVRDGIPQLEYNEVTCNELRTLINSNSLIPEFWYLISDYCNPWKLIKDDLSNIRPILVQAFNKNTLYQEGTLFNDRSVLIKYDLNYSDEISQNTSTLRARGRITWMKDWIGNEANFDFLDYSDSDNIALTTLYDVTHLGVTHKSIFPINSENNKLTLYNPKGTIIVNGNVDDTDVGTVEFNLTEMKNNIINCKELYISCDKFNVNIINATKATFNNNVINSKFEELNECTFINEFDNVQFKSLTLCTSTDGKLSNIVCHSDISEYSFDSNNDVFLYDTSKIKEVYCIDDVLHIYCPKEHYFERGMIMMHAGIVPIPDGWAICDGNSYEYNGVISQTPNLINRFIKAVSTIAEIKATDTNVDNQVTLTKENLPEHRHPHDSHTHTLSGLSGTIGESGDLSMSLDSNYVTEITTRTTSVTTGITEPDTIVTTSENVINSISDSTSGGTVHGGNHSHSISITGGILSNETSIESAQTWENEAFSIEPNYYSLIFIMKL